MKKPPATKAIKQIAWRRPHGSCGHGLLLRARQISTLSKWRPNSDYGVSRSLAFAVGKTQGKTQVVITGKPEALQRDYYNREHLDKDDQ